MTNSPDQPPVNDQTGEASPVVSGTVDHPNAVAGDASGTEDGDIPVSPTPEPPETPETTAAAESRTPGE